MINVIFIIYISSIRIFLVLKNLKILQDIKDDISKDPFQSFKKQRKFKNKTIQIYNQNEYSIYLSKNLIIDAFGLCDKDTLEIIRKEQCTGIIIVFMFALMLGSYEYVVGSWNFPGLSETILFI